MSKVYVVENSDLVVLPTVPRDDKVLSDMKDRFGVDYSSDDSFGLSVFDSREDAVEYLKSRYDEFIDKCGGNYWDSGELIIGDAPAEYDKFNAKTGIAGVVSDCGDGAWVGKIIDEEDLVAVEDILDDFNRRQTVADFSFGFSYGYRPHNLLNVHAESVHKDANQKPVVEWTSHLDGFIDPDSRILKAYYESVIEEVNDSLKVKDVPDIEDVSEDADDKSFE